MSAPKAGSTTSEPPGLPATVYLGIAEMYTPAHRIEDAALVVEDGTVRWRGARTAVPDAYAYAERVDLGGRGVIPGLVDAHTHLLWSGSRVEDHRLRAAGTTYGAVLASGGGIHATVRATLAAGDDTLLRQARARAQLFLRGGVTALEVKTGYGLTVEGELRLLALAHRLAREAPQRMTVTLLLHLPPPDRPRTEAVERLERELIPEAARRRLAEAVDVFIDEGAFTLAEGRRLLNAARAHGLAVKAHAEQLTHTGAARLVAELGGLSADHLERAGDGDLAALARAGSVATLLPGAALILRAPLPTAERLRRSGVRVAVASDHNPGSSPLFGLLPALRLAAPMTGMTLEEVLLAGTAHAADALARPTWGRLEPGCVADFLVVEGPRALLPLVVWGVDGVAERYVGGRRVVARPEAGWATAVPPGACT